jgi:regulatory protein
MYDEAPDPDRDRPDHEVEPDPESVARTICLNLLTGAPRSRGELATALRKRNVPDDVAARVLDRLTEVNLIDDAAYAEAYVESRHRERGASRAILRLELRRKGVDDDTVSAALEQIGADAEAAAAEALVAKRLASTSGLPPDKRVRRLAGMLMRKGYPAGLAYRVVRAALAAEGTDVADTPELVELDL